MKLRLRVNPDPYLYQKNRYIWFNAQSTYDNGNGHAKFCAREEELKSSYFWFNTSWLEGVDYGDIQSFWCLISGKEKVLLPIITGDDEEDTLYKEFCDTIESLYLEAKRTIDLKSKIARKETNPYFGKVQAITS